MSEQEHNCPECGGRMHWKNLEKPHCPACTPEAKGTSETKKAHSMRATRYVYHVHGHAKLHDPNPSMHTHTGQPNGPVVPFEVVLRLPYAIDSDDTMDLVREDVRIHIVTELKKQDSPFIVGDVMVRGVSKLHRILVEAGDPGGPAARIMS